MNILHISPFVPSVHAYHAGGVFMGKTVDELSKHHNLYILSFINDDKEQKLVDNYQYKNAKFIKMNLIQKAFNALTCLYRPNMFGIRSSIRFTYHLIKIIKRHKIDAIQAEYTAMGQFVWIKKLFPNIKFNLVEHDVAIQSYQRKTKKGIVGLYNKFQENRVLKCERKYCQKADIVFALNQKDVRLLKENYNVKNIETLMPYYGIDLEDVVIDMDQKIPNSICFVGQMGRPENDIAGRRLINIFNQLENKEKYKLYIIGANPTPELQKMVTDNIIVTGFVDVIEDEIKKCQVAVFPLDYGAGIKLKVLLSFGLGLPVITTDVGAEGIDEDGDVLLLCNNDQQIKEEMEKLLSDPEYLERKSHESLSYVKEHFSWSESQNVYAKIYK